MKFNDDVIPHVELTRKNLLDLLAKLDNPASAKSIIDGERRVIVKAVENAEHYAGRPGYVEEQ